MKIDSQSNSIELEAIYSEETGLRKRSPDIPGSGEKKQSECRRIEQLQILVALSARRLLARFVAVNRVLNGALLMRESVADNSL
jgi:hypothetical protein